MADSTPATATAPPPRPARTVLSLLVPLLAIVSLLLLLAGAVAGGAAWLLTTEGGTQWLLQRLPGVQVKNFQGALLGSRWRADSLRVEWAGGTQWVLVEKLAADGLQWQLLPHEHAWIALQLQTLSAAKVTVHPGPPSKEPSPLPPQIRPPLQLALGSASVDELVIEGQQPLRRLALQGLSFDPRPDARHGVQRLGFEGFTLAVAGSLQVANVAPYALKADATLRPLQDPESPLWAAVVQAGGSLAELDLAATLRGRPLPGRDAPQADVRAGLRPMQAWPLVRLDARTDALDLAALHAKAPQTRLSGQAVLGGGADKQPLVAKVEIENTLPGRWNERRLPLSKLALELKGQLDRPDLVELSRFEATLADAMRGAGRVHGTAVWQGHDVALELTLDNVTPQRLDSRAAAMTLSGPIAASITGVPALVVQKEGPPPPAIQWTLDLKGQLDKAQQTVRLAVEGSANDGALELKKVRAESGDAVAELTASVARAGRADWRLQTQGQLANFDPLPWWPGDPASAWRKGPHRFSGNWQFDVRLPGDADQLPALTLAQRVAGNGQLKIHDAQLAGVPLSAEVKLGYAPARGGGPPATLRADLDLAGNLFAAEGRADPAGSGDADRWQVEAKVDRMSALAPLFQLVPALAAWGPRQGNLTAAISAEGRWPMMRSEGSLRVSQLAAGPLTLARGSSSWRMASYGEMPQSALIEAAGIAWGGQRADNVRAEMRGTLADHRIEVSGAMPVLPPQAVEQMLGLQGQSGTRALLTAQAGWTAEGTGAGRYRLRIERLLVGSWDGSAGGGPPASGWAEARDLKAEAQFAAHRLVTLQADAGRLRVGDGLGMKWDEVRVDLRGALPLIQLRADIEPFALAPLLARMQPTAGWGGDLRLTAHIDVRAAERMDAEVVFERQDGDLHLTSADGTQLMGLTEARLSVTAHDGLWNFTPVLRGRTLGEISGRVKVQSTPERRWPQAEAPIEGVVVLSVADVGIWSAWVPPGWRLGGAVRGMADVSGTFGAPQYSGNVTARGLALRNLLQGVNFSDGEVAIKLQGETAEIERFTVRGGDGRLNVSGGATFGKDPRGRFKIAADHFRVLGRVDRLVVMSGAIDLDLQAERGKVAGRFVLDEMLYDASRRDAPSLDDDVNVRRPGVPQYQAADAAAGKQRYALDVAVDIDMGQKAVFRGWGLDTGLRGQLSVRSPNNRLEVVGTINAVNGKFASYGQKLDIERGIVSFSGALGNPRLDVLALRPNLDGSVRVGVTVTGLLQELRIRLYSEPDMSENDKLAWLMLGRAPDSLGRNEVALLQRAAVALLSGDGEAPTDALMKSLGITDLSLRTGDSEVRETVIGIGKQLSARWYVGYERGVNATTGTWQLIYRAAQRYQVRMQSGLENALDIIWTWRLQQTPPDAAMRKSTLIPK